MEKPTVKNELQTMMLDMTDKANELKIVDQESFDITSQVIVDLAAMKKKIVAYHKETKDSTRKAKDVAYQKEKDDLASINSADIYIRKIRIAYDAEVEKRRKKEQDRLDALAKKKADREREKLIARAAKTDDSEEKEELQQRAQDVYVPPNIAVATMEKTTKFEGGGRTTWIHDIEVKITDEIELLKEIIDPKSDAPMTLVKFNNLKPWIKTAGIKNGQIKGIKIVDIKRESVKT